MFAAAQHYYMPTSVYGRTTCCSTSHLKDSAYAGWKQGGSSLMDLIRSSSAAIESAKE